MCVFGVVVYVVVGVDVMTICVVVVPVVSLLMLAHVCCCCYGCWYCYR